jgi:hypothetical protein
MGAQLTHFPEEHSLLLKNLCHHVEILIKHRASDVARRDLGDKSAAGPAVHIGVSHPNYRQLPLASKIAISTHFNEQFLTTHNLPDVPLVETMAALKVQTFPATSCHENLIISRNDLWD